MQRGGKTEIVLNNTAMTVKSVCKKCNNGWMSALEEEVKPILTPMFDDNAVSLNPEQQHTLAIWITKMAFLFDSTKGRNTKDIFYKKIEGVALRESRQLPQLTRIWIGRLNEIHRAITGIDFRRQTTIGPVEGSVLTLTNEYFVAQVVSVHLTKTPTGPTARLEPKPGEWNKALATLWPVKKSIVNWPPRFSFTNGGPSGYGYLLDRWRIGDPVQKLLFSEDR